MSTPPQSIEERISGVLSQNDAYDAGPEPVAQRPTETEQEEPQTEPQRETQEDPREEPREEPKEEPKEDEPSEGQETDEEVIEVSDIHDLAKHLGVEPDQLYDVEVPFTIDGERRTFTLGDIKDRMTAESEAEAIAQAAAQEREAYEKARTQGEQTFQAYSQQMAHMLQAMEQKVLQDYQNLDWDGLKAQNPGQWAAKQTELQGVQQWLQQARAQAAQSWKQTHEAWQQQQAQMAEQRLEREQKALFKAIPEWRNQEVADAERRELTDFLLNSGYSREEIEGVADHRAVVLARDAMRYRQQAKKGGAAAKKVLRIAKKVGKPGARQDKSQQSADRGRALAANLRKSGSIDAAAALIAHRDAQSERRGRR